MKYQRQLILDFSRNMMLQVSKKENIDPIQVGQYKKEMPASTKV